MKCYSKVFTALSGFLLLNFSVLLVDAAFPEPLCSKFAYEEQLLEKMVRMEFYMENLEKELRKTVTDAIVKVSEQYDGTVKNMLDVSGKIGRLEKRVELIENNKLEEKLVGRINNVQNRLETNLNETRTILTTTSSEMKHAKGHIDTPKVAFNAREATDLSLEAEQVVVFKTVIMNEGGAYNNETGTFTAPIDGLYQFNAQLCVVNGKDLDYGIRVQKTVIISGECRTPSDANDGKCFSFSAVGRVQKGETVVVAFVEGSTSTENILYQNSNDWNSFSGVLISAYI